MVFDIGLSDRVSSKEWLEYITSRGYGAVPFFDNSNTKVVGYILRGPRGNKKTVCIDVNGLMSMFVAKLWCDVVDYSTLKAKRNRREKLRREGC